MKTLFKKGYNLATKNTTTTFVSLVLIFNLGEVAYDMATVQSFLYVEVLSRIASAFLVSIFSYYLISTLNAAFQGVKDGLKEETKRQEQKESNLIRKTIEETENIIELKFS